MADLILSSDEEESEVCRNLSDKFPNLSVVKKVKSLGEKNILHKLSNPRSLKSQKSVFSLISDKSIEQEVDQYLYNLKQSFDKKIISLNVED